MAYTGTTPSIGGSNEESPNIIDIRSDAAEVSLKKRIIGGLNPKDGGEKSLPTLLLYDEHGLRLFEDITYLEEYYLTGQEIHVLEAYAGRIAERIPDGSMVMELGSGNLRKIRVLLDSLEKSNKNIAYYALDLSLSELERTLADIPAGALKNVKCFGLLGTYDDGLAWLQKPENAVKPKTILSLGSSIGNFRRNEAADFLSQFAAVIGTESTMLIGVDACQDPEKVYRAYNDKQGLTHRFVLNGLQHANALLGHESFDPGHWSVIGEYDVEAGRHHAFVVPSKNVDVLGIPIARGERVRIEESYKYSVAQTDKLWADAGVVEGASWWNEAGDYALHMLSMPAVSFSTEPGAYATNPVPSLTEWHKLWATWDIVTKQMIHKDELLSKPIKLRNACIFYLGHIPTFLDMHLTKATDGKPTEPTHYQRIFERGIDPDVDNPMECHAHSEIPDTWPPIEEILAFQDRVRTRVATLYESGQAEMDKWLGRVIHLGFEHEIMHLETILYMLVQSERTCPPTGTIRPDFEQLAILAKTSAMPNQWIKVPAQTITIGMDDPENTDGPERFFGWDIEKPSRQVDVIAFLAKARPITNGEYAKYAEATGKSHLPASWAETGQQNGYNDGHINGYINNTSEPSSAFLHGKTVRTVYGRVPLKLAVDWPVAASYDELLGCAKYMGGRIPTLEEARSIYAYVDQMKKEEAAKALGRTIPAVNGHLLNDGVEETPPSTPSFKGTSSAKANPNLKQLFFDLKSVNVGFKHWHPMPVTQNGGRLSGQGDMGGVWEWTSSVLEMHKGYESMKLYPAYTADFFDGKHNIVLGGSWATHPRVAGRKTFINWYQRNYPYVWAGARLVRDV